MNEETHSDYFVATSVLVPTQCHFSSWLGQSCGMVDDGGDFTFTYTLFLYGV